MAFSSRPEQLVAPRGYRDPDNPEPDQWVDLLVPRQFKGLTDRISRRRLEVPPQPIPEDQWVGMMTPPPEPAAAPVPEQPTAPPPPEDTGTSIRAIRTPDGRIVFTNIPQASNEYQSKYGNAQGMSIPRAAWEIRRSDQAYAAPGGNLSSLMRASVQAEKERAIPENPDMPQPNAGGFAQARTPESEFAAAAEPLQRRVILAQLQEALRQAEIPQPAMAPSKLEQDFMVRRMQANYDMEMARQRAAEEFHKISQTPGMTPEYLASEKARIDAELKEEEARLRQLVWGARETVAPQY
jgi:hypothetical protein